VRSTRHVNVLNSQGWLVCEALMWLQTSARLMLSFVSKLLCRVCFLKPCLSISTFQSTAFQVLPARLPFIVCLSTSAFHFLPIRLPFIVCLSTSALRPAPTRMPFNFCLRTLQLENVYPLLQVLPASLETGNCRHSASLSRSLRCTHSPSETPSQLSISC